MSVEEIENDHPAVRVVKLAVRSGCEIFTSRTTYRMLFTQTHSSILGPQEERTIAIEVSEDGFISIDSVYLGRWSKGEEFMKTNYEIQQERKAAKRRQRALKQCLSILGESDEA